LLQIEEEIIELGYNKKREKDSEDKRRKLGLRGKEACRDSQGEI